MTPAKVDRTTNNKRPQSRASKKNSSKKDAKKKITKPSDSEENQEEEQVLEVDEKPKREAWLDNLPPVIKPDEELHQQLIKQRRESQKQKYYEICQNEAEAILNYTFQFMEIQNSPNKWAVSNLKADFLLGKFFTKVDTEPKPLAPSKSLQFCHNTNLYNPEKFLEPKPINTKESLFSWYASINIQNKYDANSQMDSVLQNLDNSMQPYTNPQPYPEPVSFPFVVCITGPPHSGRTSIAQFIQRFFNAFYINITSPIRSDNQEGEPQLIDSYEIDVDNKNMTISSNDDKYIMSKINEALQNIELNCGLLIRNYPINKIQAGLLEKALLAYAKHKQTQNQDPNTESPTYLKMINCIFRTALTAEEVQNQISGRLKNVKTGEIFHTKFRPPSVIENSDDIVPFTLQPDEIINASSYNKIVNSTSQLDILNKKGTLVIPVALVDSTDKLELQIENALRQIYANNNVPVPFSSFVQYRNLDKLKYAKYCNKIYNVWFDECIPQFGRTLARIFEQTRVIKEKMDYLFLCAKDQLLLKLYQPDKRQILSENFIQQSPDERNYSQFFKDFWELSIEIRDRQLAALPDLLQRCGLVKLKSSIHSNETEIFEALMKRFFIVEWYYQFVRSIEDHSAKDDDPALPTLDFDPKDYYGIAKRIGISNSLPILFKRPTKPEIVKVNMKNQSVLGGPPFRSVSQLQKSKSPMKPHLSFLSFKQKNPQKIEVPNSLSHLSFPKPPLHFSNSIDALHDFDKKDKDGKDTNRSEANLSGNKISDDSDLPIQSYKKDDDNENESNSINDNIEDCYNVNKNDDEIPEKAIVNPKNSNEKDRINAFLNFVYDSITVRVLRNDAALNRTIFSFLIDDIEKIDKLINESAEVLMTEMKQWINKKYSQEMEMFSEKLRKLRKENVIDGKLYEISYQFKEEDERDSFLKRFIPYLPNNETKIEIDADKITELVKLIPEDQSIISLDEILELGKQTSFTDKELAELEISIRMEAVPDFLDVVAFKNSFTGNESEQFC